MRFNTWREIVSIYLIFSPKNTFHPREKTRRIKPWILIPLLFFMIRTDGFQVFAQELSKPTVAVKQPIIGEGIPLSLYEYLSIDTVWAELEACLRATRRFDVVTRDVSELKEIRKEQQAAQTYLFKKNAASQGKLQDADYFLFSTVQDFEFERINQPVPNISNKYITKESGLLGLSIQLIDTETGQIKSTIYAKSNLTTQDQVINAKPGEPREFRSTQLVVDTVTGQIIQNSYVGIEPGDHPFANTKYAEPSRVLFTHLAQDAAARFSDRLIDTVFPMVVINIEDNLIWINRGEDGGLKEGETLLLFRPGKELVDPYTKEKLGATEAYVGKAKIVRVNPKLTTVELLQDQMTGTIHVGDILRKP